MTIHQDASAAAEAAARQLLEQRLAPIRNLAAAHTDREDLTARLADADKSVTRAFRAAVAAGWSPDDLSKLGYSEPGKNAPSRPSRPRTPARRNTSDRAASGQAVPDQRHGEATTVEDPSQPEAPFTTG